MNKLVDIHSLEYYLAIIKDGKLIQYRGMQQHGCMSKTCLGTEARRKEYERYDEGQHPLVRVPSHGRALRNP